MNWQDDAACKGQPTSVFFPDHGNSAGPAKEICATCPVIAECRAAGMNVAYGVWGGLTEPERFGTQPLQPSPRRVCRECGASFRSRVTRPTCDECRTRIRRETWRLSRQRTRGVAS